MNIEIAEKSSLDRFQLATVLAKGLFDDPLTINLFPDKADREKHMTYFLMVFINYGINHGTIYLLKDESGHYCGGAIWIDPKFVSVNSLAFIINMLSPPAHKLFFVLGFGGLNRFSSIAHEFEKAHKCENNPHYYLLNLSIAPEFQNKGYGTQLIKPGIEKAKSEKINCYLETCNLRNHSFYFRNNFNYIFDSNTDPKFWTMRAKFHHL
jgi:GNAT superfamily N-acetyltransferase